MAEIPTSQPQLTPEENSTWQPQPYPQRKSQNLNFGDYVVRGLFKILVGGASGWAVGKGLDRVTHSTRYSSIGAFVGSIIGSFFTWQRTEKYEQEIAQLNEEYNSVPGLRQTNAELATDNAMLTRMVAFQKEKLASSQVAAASVQHEGAVHSTEAEQAI